MLGGASFRAEREIPRAQRFASVPGNAGTAGEITLQPGDLSRAVEMTCKVGRGLSAPGAPCPGSRRETPVWMRAVCLQISPRPVLNRAVVLYSWTRESVPARK